MSAHFVTALVVLSLVSPTVAYAQDSLTVEQRLSRTETQLAAVMAALNLGSHAAATGSSDAPEELAGIDHLRLGFPATGDPDDTTLNRGFFVMLHDKGKKVANWVAYHLIREITPPLCGATEEDHDVHLRSSVTPSSYQLTVTPHGPLITPQTWSCPENCESGQEPRSGYKRQEV